MITLHSFPASFDCYSSSPFCTKVAMMLQLSGLAWQRQDLRNPEILAEMPHQKLPVLETPEGKIPDSETIRHWLEAQGAEFFPGLNATEKAHALAWIRMSEHHLQQLVVFARWGDDVIWPEVRDVFFAMVPAPLRDTVSAPVRERVLGGLDFQGMTRYSAAEVEARFEDDFTAIAAVVAEQPFLMGAQLSAADLSVAPFLQAVANMPFDRPLITRLAGDTVLMSYVARVMSAVPLPK